MSARRIVLRFPHRLVDQPIVCNLVRRYDLDFNILKAAVTPREEGLLVLEIQGSEDSLQGGLDYLAEVGVLVQPLSQDVIRHDARCIHCGACTPVCPTHALWLDTTTMHVEFDSNKCIACEHCVKACPTRAMEVKF